MPPELDELEELDDPDAPELDPDELLLEELFDVLLLEEPFDVPPFGASSEPFALPPPTGASFAAAPAFDSAAFTASSSELPCGLPIHATFPSPPTTNAHGMPLRFAAIIHSLAIDASPSNATR